MAYPYTTGEARYPGRKISPRKKREEREEEGPPIPEEPGITDIAALPWKFLKEDIADTRLMKPSRFKYTEEGFIGGDERAFTLDPLHPTKMVKGAWSSFWPKSVQWNNIAPLVEAEYVWKDYIFNQTLPGAFTASAFDVSVSDPSGRFTYSHTLSGDFQNNVLSFVCLGRTGPIRWRGAFDKARYSPYALSKMADLLATTDPAAAGTLQNYLTQWKDLEADSLKIKLHDRLFDEASVADPAIAPVLAKRGYRIRDDLERKYGKKPLAWIKTDIADRQKVLQGQHCGSWNRGYKGDVDQSIKAFEKAVREGKISKDDSFVQFWNTIRMRAVYFETLHFLKTMDKGETTQAKVYYLAKEYLYLQWFKTFQTGPLKVVNPNWWYSALLHPSANVNLVNPTWADKLLIRFLGRRNPNTGKLELWDFENKVLKVTGLQKLSDSIIRVRTKGWRFALEKIFGKKFVASLAPGKLLSFWGKGGVARTMASYAVVWLRTRGTAILTRIVGRRLAKQIISLAVKGLIQLVGLLADFFTGFLGTVAAAVVTWLGGKVISKTWEKVKTGEIAAYALGGCGCGCLTFLAPFVLVMIAVMSIIPGMKKYEAGAGIPGYGGGGRVEFEGVPPDVIEGDLPPGFENIDLWPLITQGQLTSEFGLRYVEGINPPWHFHRGVDIDSTLIGTSVGSIGSGRVIEVYTGANDDDVYGNYVRVEHSGGYVSLYGHLGTINVSVGDSVGAGGTLGTVDNSGNSTGTHLHLGVMVPGQGYVDPCRILDCP